MKKRTLAVLAVMAATCGLIGFRPSDCADWADALFHILQMFVLNYSFDDKPINCWLQVARFLAPVVTFVGLQQLLLNLANRFQTHAKSMQPGSIAVYAPEEIAELLVKRLKDLGENGVAGGSEFLSADTYILYNDSAWNARFWTRYNEKLLNRQVYLRTDTLPAHAVSSKNLHLFSPAEIVARSYWKESELLDIAAKCSYQCEVVLLGFGALGEELLYWGMQNNVFSPSQRIRYHVFGDATVFLSSHPYIREITDPVIPHADGWLDHLDILRGASLVLVLPEVSGAPAQEKTVYQLLSLLPEQKLVVFSEQPTLLSELSDMQCVTIVDMMRDPLDPECIMGDQLIRDAMRINMRYAKIYEHKDETPENSRILWDDLSTFLRYSNIGAADYHVIRKRLLKKKGIEPRLEAIDGQTMEWLAELEHMRWCRFYWLNNWRWGKVKDPVRRVHNDLLSYESLRDSEKQKDRDTVKVMLEL